MVHAATASIGAIVLDPQAVCEPCENYCYGTRNWEPTADGALTICGCNDFGVFEPRTNGLQDYEGGIVTHEFLRECVDYLEADEALDIQTAVITKYPILVLTKRSVVRGGEGLRADLSPPEPTKV